MVNNSQIKYHSQNIIKVFGQVIDAVIIRGDLNCLGLERLGKSHFHYGVKAEDFKVSFDIYLLQLGAHISLFYGV